MGGIWPVHCIMNSYGHALHRELDVQAQDIQILKGMNPKFDSYSAFKDDGGEETDIISLIKHFDINEVDICGLASEYCVAFTAQDAIELYLKTTIIKDACRCIDIKAEEETFFDLAEIGVNFKTSKEVI